MESIRNFLKSWPGRIFLMLCLSPLLILGLESYFSSGTSTNEVVKVGDISISREEYQNAISNQRNELISAGVEPSLINSTALNTQVLKSLINQALLKQQTINLGMHVSDEVIESILKNDPQFFDEEGQFSDERFTFSLKQNGITKPQLFEDYRHQINVNQLFNAVANTALYPEQSVKQLITLENETRPIWVYRLPWQDFKDKVSVSDSDIKKYYDEHQQELNSLERVDLAYLILDPENLEVDTITDKDLQAEYDAFRVSYEGDYSQRVSQILVTGEDAKQKLKSIENRLNKGDDFAELAKEFSEDEASKNKGGDIGIFNPDVFGEDSNKVAKAIQALGEGDVSKPVKTQYGYQIFKVTDLSGESIPSFESMEEELKSRAEQRKRDEIMADKITRINEMATDGLAIEDIAQEENLKVKKIKDYSKKDNTTILNQPAVIESAFDDFLIQDESVSTNITVNLKSVWVQPSNYRPIAPLSLKQATDEIKSILVQNKATEYALKEANKISTMVNKQGIKDIDLSFTSLGDISRQSPLLMGKEKAVAFAKNTSKGKLLAISQTTDYGASVLVLDAIKKPSIDDIPNLELLKTAALLRDTRGQEQFTDYLHYLETATDIKRNHDLIKEVSGSN